MSGAEDSGLNVFGSLKNRATNALPSFSRSTGFGSPRERTIGSDRARDESFQISEEPQGRSRTVDGTTDRDNVLSRRRSRSTPGDNVRYSLRQKALHLRDSAWLDLRTRASNLELPKFPSFQFSLPFSDSSAQVGTIRRTNWHAHHESDNFSLTSLEAESITVHKKGENNRLRGLLEGLPRIGLPGTSPAEPAFAGLDKLTKHTNIVVLGGYRGSILRSADDKRMLWIPVKVGLGIRKVDLELPLAGDAEELASKTVIADGMLTHIGPVDISRRLLKRLKEMEWKGYCKVQEFGYDWRLGGDHLSAQLIRFLEERQGKSIVIAHSLGGLITLHALRERPDLFQGIIFAGTPFGGCPNILGPFRYGDGVLLNREILNARTNFSMRSSFLLLPTHKRCFVDIASGKEILVDFFDAKSWKTYGLSPEVTADHGQHDKGEATDLIGMAAAGGVVGPSMGPSAGSGDHRTSESAEAVTQPDKPDFIQQAAASTLDDPSTYEYLQKTLATTMRFKSELNYSTEIQYPPIAILRSATTPTVRGCCVHGEQGIKDGDYSKFIYSQGDGVVTHASADIRSLGQGFADHIVKDMGSDRGHIGLLGDLHGVEQCLQAILEASFAKAAGTDSNQVDQQDLVAALTHDTSNWQPFTAGS